MYYTKSKGGLIMTEDINLTPAEIGEIVNGLAREQRDLVDGFSDMDLNDNEAVDKVLKRLDEISYAIGYWRITVPFLKKEAGLLE